MLKSIRWDLMWEALKLPLRLFVFAVMGFAVQWFIDYFAASELPIAPVLIALLTYIDKLIHIYNKEKSDKPLEGLDRGLLPF